jgi:hypothetical protein
LRRIGHFGVRSVSIGARHINDDSLWLVVLRVEFVFEGGEGAQKQVAGVGHDCGATRGDAVLGLEQKEAGKKVVDRDGGLEFGKASDEFGSKAGGLVLLLLATGMLGAEGGERIGNGQAAAALAGMVLAAAVGGSRRQMRSVDKTGVNRCGAHDVPRFSEN